MIVDPGVSAIKSEALLTFIQPAIVVSILMLATGWVIFTTLRK